MSVSAFANLTLNGGVHAFVDDLKRAYVALDQHSSVSSMWLEHLRHHFGKEMADQFKAANNELKWRNISIVS
jgi:hypothetical protein